MTITEVRDVLRILAGIGDKIRKFEIEALFKILVAHTDERYIKMSADDIGLEKMLNSLIEMSDSLSREEVKTFYRISIDHGECPICAGCRTEIRDIHDFSWDHSNPKCFGGPDDVSNMQPMHRCCNNFKGDKLYPISTEAYLHHLEQNTDTKTSKHTQENVGKLNEQAYVRHLKRVNPKNTNTNDIKERKNKEFCQKHRQHIRLNGWFDLNNFINDYEK